MDFNTFNVTAPAILQEGGRVFVICVVMLLAIGIGGLLALRDPRAELRIRSLVPEEKSTRHEISLQLAQTGFAAPNPVRNFFLIRLGLAIPGPGILAAIFALHSQGMSVFGFGNRLAGMSMLNLGQTCMIMVATGFHGPGWWLKSQISARRLRSEHAFPNTLDLLQISIGAGQGFDTAMAGGGRELARVAPEISSELLAVQQAILARRDRETAMPDMAARLGIDEARSFVNMVIQSLQYGTSLTDALTRYAVEMRMNRELRAQEKANKLPVQMSGVMAVLMLPALFLITLAPTIIRRMAIFGKSCAGLSSATKSKTARLTRHFDGLTQ